MDQYALTTATYGQQLFGLLSDEPVREADRLLVVGGIQYDERGATFKDESPNDFLKIISRGLELSTEDRSWPYLDGAERETQVVTGFWGTRGQVVTLSDAAADERAITDTLPHARFAHLATHGFFDESAEVYQVDLRKQRLFEGRHTSAPRGATVAGRNPLLMTGIVLAGANVAPEKDDLGIPISDDGILTAEEIQGLDLRNTELVTLSACETGLGDVANGEGVMGLQRALHQAGVRSVIASLWKVSDDATCALMAEFYRNLWEKKLSKVESLRQAQLAVLRNYDPDTGEMWGLGTKTVIMGEAGVPKNDKPKSDKRLHPRFWAAFQLSGDWR